MAIRRGPVIITVPVPDDSLETIESKMEHISNVILRHSHLKSYRSPSTEALNRCNRSQDAAASARVEMTELEKISSDVDWLNAAPQFPSCQIRTPLQELSSLIPHIVRKPPPNHPFYLETSLRPLSTTRRESLRRARRVSSLRPWRSTSRFAGLWRPRMIGVSRMRRRVMRLGS